jgi:hypothetical protein
MAPIARAVSCTEAYAQIRPLAIDPVAVLKAGRDISATIRGSLMLALSVEGVVMPELILPKAWVEKIATAELPQVYRNAVVALAECDRLDECATWTNKAANSGVGCSQRDRPSIAALW